MFCQRLSFRNFASEDNSNCVFKIEVAGLLAFQVCVCGKSEYLMPVISDAHVSGGV